MQENYLEYLKEIQKKKILCIGDIILDSYVTNELIKISEEDPINVIKKKNQIYKLGGVGNVALNLKNFGVDLDLITVGAKDKNYKIIINLLKSNKINHKTFYLDDVQTTVKERQYINNYHLLRTDNEKIIQIKNQKINFIINFIQKKIKKNNYDAILVSDYGKGLVSEFFFSKLVKIANKSNLKIFVDPKSNNLKKYDGSYCVKANNKEMDQFLKKFNSKTIDLINNRNIKNIKKNFNNLDIKNFIITRSDQNTLYFKNDKKFKISSSKIKKLNVVNTTGAGDTFISVFVCFYLVTKKFDLSISVANLFSEFAVKKFGTYAPNLYEIITDILKIKIIDFQKNLKILKSLSSLIKKKESFKLGFTNGCFDILHSGHIKLLKEAKQNCDLLIVGLNSDNSVRINKGPNRPLNSINSRLEVLSSLEFVDLVCVFNEKTPLKLITALLPKILFKGSDYKNKFIAGADLILKNNGKIKLININKNYSTSNIINKMKN